MAVLQWGMLGSKLQLDEHHVVTHTQRQGQRRAARQEVTDLQRAACQPRSPGPWYPQPGPARPPALRDLGPLAAPLWALGSLSVPRTLK